MAVVTTESSEFVLLRYQQKWIADKSNVKIAEKSRRIGLTWAEAADDVLLAATSKDGGGMDCMYIGTSKDMAREYIDTCADWARHYSYICSNVEEDLWEEENGDKEITVFRITFASGFEVVALSSKPRSLRGRQGKVVIDEAAFQDDLPELIKAAMAMLMWGGKVVIISTHNGIANHFNELIQLSRAGKKPYSVHRIPLDKAVADGLYKRICKMRKIPWSLESEKAWIDDLEAQYGDGADEELYCVPAQGGGTYLSYNAIADCMKDNIPFIRYNQTDEFARASKEYRKAEVQAWCEEHLKPHLMALKPEHRHFFGEDFARKGDATNVWIWAVDEVMHRYTPFVLELRNMPHEQQKQVLHYVLDRLPRFGGGAMDAGGNGSYLAEVTAQKYGSIIEEVHFTQNWYIENMPKYKSAFEDKELSIPKHDDIMTDHQAIKLVKGVPKIPSRDKGVDGLKRHGDSAISGCLGYISTIKDDAVYEFESLGDNRINNDINEFMGD